MPSQLVHDYLDIDHTKIYCSTENLFNYHFAMMSRFGYHLLPKINSVILQLSEAGLLENYRIFQIYENGLINTNASKYTSIRINRKASFDLKKDQSDDIVSLNSEHVGGAIFILIFGHSIASIVFIIEYIIHICPFKKKV